jgi:hypothetical protein
VDTDAVLHGAEGNAIGRQDEGAQVIEYVLPLKTKNPTNNRQHWRTVWRRAKVERSTSCTLTKLKINESGMRLPVVATLTRFSFGELDDDGLRSALKSVRDGIADAFGVDDSSKSALRFLYAQEKCKRGAFCVRVTLEST